MTNIAIRGHKTRGKEVIEILEMFGGVNKYEISDAKADLLYAIRSHDKFIIGVYPTDTFIVFTLEEFLKKFPYKIGDRVRVPEYESEVRISKMYWDGNEVQYEVVTDEVEWYSAKELNKFNEPNKPNKEETTEKEKNDWAKWDLPEGYEFQDKEGNVINTDVIKLVKKQPHYPKTYEECCDVLGLSYMQLGVVGYACEKLGYLQRLLLYRQAYWKIAGEQMGLGKPWEPKWEIDNVKYSILVVENEIRIGDNEEIQRLLVFPTEEMRDTFLENFGHLIELCKELL